MKRVLIIVTLFLMFNFLFVEKVAGIVINSQNIPSEGTIFYNMHVLRWDDTAGVKNMGYSPTNISLISQNLDMYTVKEWMSTDFVNLLHQENPELKILLYRNFRGIYNYSSEWQMALDNDWILRDIEGNLIHSNTWPENYMVDIGNLDYQYFLVSWIVTYMDEWEIDGIFADYGLVAAVPEHQCGGMTGFPINPRTGQEYTDDEWINDLITLLNNIKNAEPDILTIANGISTGARFFEHWGNPWDNRERWERVLDSGYLDGFISESMFFFEGSPGNYLGMWDYQDSLDFLDWIQDNWLDDPDKIYAVCSYSGESEVPSGHTPDELSDFIFTSSLLCLDKPYKNYVICHNNMFSSYVQSLYKIDLGESLGDYHVIAGTQVYERNFSNVKVLVNPTYNTYTISLDREYMTLDDTIIIEVTLEGHTGVILKNK